MSYLVSGSAAHSLGLGLGCAVPSKVGQADLSYAIIRIPMTPCHALYGMSWSASACGTADSLPSAAFPPPLRGLLAFWA